ncbi:MAG: hypothetical protein A3K10_00460 [Bacteroidetes bacterium RIFCSPLOWO2_12_FULL_31_6]|nr:MAG: hypothetical protein A3K10_00460 [Bacteroidetes bacterium RIFCSPLOWO2_12_FULL_31_6]
MKVILSSLLAILLSNCSFAQITLIPDTGFEQALIQYGYDFGLPDGQVLTNNIDTVTYLYVGSRQITDLTGIQDFTALEYLDCNFNQLSSINVTQNTVLTCLITADNPLGTLDITQNSALISLNCWNNQLTNLNITQNTFLKYLSCQWNQLSTVDLSQNVNLIELDCNLNQMIILDVTLNTALTTLNCRGNLLTSLNLTNNTALEKLYCYSNQLTQLNLSQNSVLNDITCHNNQLTCLNIKNGNNSNFIYFFAHNNPNLTCIEVDNVGWSTSAPNWYKDATASYSTSCPNPCLVGIDENNLSNLSLYPNPTTGKITIDLVEVKQGLKATLTNSLGQVIFNQNYGSTNNIDLDLKYPKGMYFLTIKTQGEIITKKIVIE